MSLNFISIDHAASEEAAMKRIGSSLDFETRVVTVVLVCALFVVAAYILTQSHLPLGGTASWGQFGDYFGGLMNPLVGVMTVMLVAMTLRVTRDEARATQMELAAQRDQLATQVEMLMRQERLTDLHRRLEGTLAAWKDLTRTAQFIGRIGAHEDGGSASVSGTSWESIFNKPWILHAARRWRMSDYDRRELSSSFDQALLVLREFGQYLSEYEIESRNRNLTDYYRRRLALAANLFDAWGILPENVRHSVIEQDNGDTDQGARIGC